MSKIWSKFLNYYKYCITVCEITSHSISQIGPKTSQRYIKKWKKKIIHLSFTPEFTFGVSWDLSSLDSSGEKWTRKLPWVKSMIFFFISNDVVTFHKDALCHVCLKLAQWFWRRSKKCEKFKTDKFWSKKSSYEHLTQVIKKNCCPL